ncbi:MAG: radical SAM protein [Clostridia bacterium]|nr:radical SAM protein [Clostridia bacterium]
MLELFKDCKICPRKCGVDRLSGQIGYCKMPALPVMIARVAPHMWEEPCISGSKGSGTVFFTGCNMQCVFCQNEAISRGRGGRSYTVEELAEAFLKLQSSGVHNINLVTPTHYMPAICDALDIARSAPSQLTIPVVYNCGGYELPEIISLLRGYVDIFMPDVKYFSDSLSVKYSKAAGYFRYAADSLEMMLSVAGRPVFGKDGLMKKGVLVRHLVLPTRAEDSKKVLKNLWRRFGNDIVLSVMNQYTPMKHFEDYPELSIPLAKSSYEKVLDFAYSLGFENIYSQEGGTVSESFIPPFEV